MLSLSPFLESSSEDDDDDEDVEDDAGAGVGCSGNDDDDCGEAEDDTEENGDGDVDDGGGDESPLVGVRLLTTSPGAVKTGDGFVRLALPLAPAPGPSFAIAIICGRHNQGKHLCARR